MISKQRNNTVKQQTKQLPKLAYGYGSPYYAIFFDMSVVNKKEPVCLYTVMDEFYKLYREYKANNRPFITITYDKYGIPTFYLYYIGICSINPEAYIKAYFDTIISNLKNKVKFNIRNIKNTLWGNTKDLFSEGQFTFSYREISFFKTNFDIPYINKFDFTKPLLVSYIYTYKGTRDAIDVVEEDVYKTLEPLSQSLKTNASYSYIQDIKLQTVGIGIIAFKVIVYNGTSISNDIIGTLTTNLIEPLFKQQLSLMSIK